MIEWSDFRDLLRYNSDTGEFWWLVRLGGMPYWRMDEPAGCINKLKGYRIINVQGVKVSAHHLAIAAADGSFDGGVVDHINGDRADNRRSNLRVVTHKENMKNQGMGKANKSGVLGVRWVDKDSLWAANIGVNGALKYLGMYKSKFEACCARKSAELKHGYHPNHGARAAHQPKGKELSIWSQC